MCIRDRENETKSFKNFNFEDYDVNETNLILVARKEIGKEEKLSSGNISVLKEKAIPSTGQQKKSKVCGNLSHIP